MKTAMIIKVLIVVTSHSQLGDTGKPTGYYLSEVSHPYFEFEKAGYQVDIASPKGGKAPMDENSRNLSDPENKMFLDRKDLVSKIENTIPLEKVKATDYQAIIFSGGHGAMWDFPKNKDLQKISSTIYQHGGVVAAVCHGPAALLNIKLADGKYLIMGKKVAAFTNEEEEAVHLTKVMPFLLESELSKKGAQFVKAKNWEEHVEVSERLVTGQNPTSAKKLGQEVVKILSIHSRE